MTSTDNSLPSPPPELSPAKKELLAKRLSGAFKGSSRAQIILPRAENGPAPLSFAQEQMWVIDQMQPGSDAYNLPVLLRLHGDIRPDLLEKALHEITRRHEVLRASFPSVDGEPAQIPSGLDLPGLTIVDLRGHPSTPPDAAVRTIIDAEAHQPFDLAHGPLVRWQLLRLEEHEHLLVLTMHHIISDGWSMGIFFRELQAFYEASLRGTPAKLPALRIQYADFSCWQRNSMQGPVLEKHLCYWRQKLAGAPSSISLPAVGGLQPGSALPARAAQASISLGKTFTEALSVLSQREGATPFMTMLAALNATLCKWTQQRDFVIGTVVAGRTSREMEDLIGCFMNFLPLRATMQGDPTLQNILAQCKATVLEAYAHQDCPFAKIVEAIRPIRTAQKNPLYNVAFLLQNFPRGDLHGELLQAEFLPVEPQAALLDLRFLAEETEDGLSLVCEYDSELFKAETVQLLVMAFREALEMHVSHPLTRLSELKLDKRLFLPAAAARQKEEQLLAISATFTAEPLAESLAFWSEKLAMPLHIEFAPYNQVFQQLLDPSSLLASNQRGINVVLLRLEDWEKPDARAESGAMQAAQIEQHVQELALAVKTAVSRSKIPWLICICPPSKGSLSDPEQGGVFARLEQNLANQLAGLTGVHLLREQDLRDLYPVADYDDPHGEELGHIPYTPVFFTALGTLLTRKIHALKRAPKKVIVLDCDQTLWTGVCGEEGPSGIKIDPPRKCLQEFMRAQLEAGMLLCLCSKNSEEDVLAVFEHRPDMHLHLEDFVAWRINWRPKSENLRALAEELQLGLESFVLVDDNPVECAETQANCPEVLTLQLPGDPELIEPFLKHAWAFDHVKLTAEDRNRTALYQQNRQRGQLQSRSLTLAEFLAGLSLEVRIEPAQTEHLARIAQLTERTNQFNFTTRRRSENEVEQLWRGSSAKLLSVSVKDRFGDYGLVGVLIYERVGEALRVDTFLLSCRVLGKGIEHRMMAHLGKLAYQEGCRWVEFKFIPSPRNKPALNFLENIGGSFARRNGEGLEFRFPAEFARDITFNPELADSPPREGIQPPSSAQPNSDGHFQVSSSQIGWIALNAQDPGMILSLVSSKLSTRGSGKPDYLAPRTDCEKQLCQIWEQLLRIERIGIREDFFELGGSSLLAVQLLAQTRKLTGKNLPLAILFQAPTVEQLARLLEDQPAARSALVALQPHGAKPPLILVHGAGGGILWGYANLAPHLGSDQPVYAIEPRTMQRDNPSVKSMAARYITDLRALQPSGPYCLGGYCFGGYVAYEMACQLAAQGEKAALVALIDCTAPNGSYEKVQWWRPTFLPNFICNFGYWLRDFFNLERKAQADFVRRQLSVFKKKLLTRLRHERERPIHLEQYINLSELPEHELELWQMHLRAGADYAPRKYPGRVTLLRTRAQPLLCSFDPAYGWADLAESVDIRMVPGSHENIFMEPDVKALAEHLKNCLAAAPSKARHQPIDGEAPGSL